MIAGSKVVLVKPQTFMNLSGQAVMELLHYYNDRIDDILVIHDDLDLPPGQLRFKQGGGAGGAAIQQLNVLFGVFGASHITRNLGAAEAARKANATGESQLRFPNS